MAEIKVPMFRLPVVHLEFNAGKLGSAAGEFFG
jgi:hypothetical protein